MGPTTCVLSHLQRLIKKLLLLIISTLLATRTNAESLLRYHFSRRSSSYLGERFYFDLPFTLKGMMIHSGQDCLLFQCRLIFPALASITTQMFTK